jgi:hypothetical protein
MSIPITTNTDTDTTLTTDTDTTIPKEVIAKIPEPDPTPIDLGETALTATTAGPIRNTGLGFRTMV